MPSIMIASPYEYLYGVNHLKRLSNRLNNFISVLHIKQQKITCDCLIVQMIP